MNLTRPALAFVLVALVAGAIVPSGAGSAAQVAAMVHASTSVHSLPSALNPSLTTVENGQQAYEASGVSAFNKCDPYYVSALVTAPRACFFGDLSSRRTMVIVGDSNVGNWVPALRAGLKPTRLRLAVLAYSGCPTPFLEYTTPSTGGQRYQQCNQWHAALPKVVARLHPVAVLASSGAVDLTTVPSATWMSGMLTLFRKLTATSPHAKRIIIGTSPYFPTSVPQCLAAESDPQKCDLIYGSGVGYSAFLSRDPKIATKAHAKLITTSQWLCTTGQECSGVIGNYLVYVDSDHVSTAYSTFLSKVMAQAVVKALA